MIDELGRILVNVCTMVPGGVVCFLPSYQYEALVYKHLQDHHVLDRIANKKKVFRESRTSSQVEHMLADYSQCIRLTSNSAGGCTGAILFAVVGGKMSEGINFSDELGRCVVMVGLPYANSHSPELKEKMDYLDRTQRKSEDGSLASKVYY